MRTIKRCTSLAGGEIIYYLRLLGLVFGFISLSACDRHLFSRDPLSQEDLIETFASYVSEFDISVKSAHKSSVGGYLFIAQLSGDGLDELLARKEWNLDLASYDELDQEAALSHLNTRIVSGELKVDKRVYQKKYYTIQEPSGLEVYISYDKEVVFIAQLGDSIENVQNKK